MFDKKEYFQYARLFVQQGMDELQEYLDDCDATWRMNFQVTRCFHGRDLTQICFNCESGEPLRMQIRRKALDTAGVYMVKKNALGKAQDALVYAFGVLATRDMFNYGGQLDHLVREYGVAYLMARRNFRTHYTLEQKLRYKVKSEAARTAWVQRVVRKAAGEARWLDHLNEEAVRNGAA